MTNMSRSSWSLLFMLLVGLMAGILLSSVWRKHFAPDIDAVSKSDTTITIDTNIFINPIPITVEVSLSDHITVEESDIIMTKDSLIVLPKSVKTYSDKSYKCQISGYQPSLDWIEVYPETRYITTETTTKRKPTRWGIGIQAGVGIGLTNNKIVGVPYVGVGVSYNLIRF